MHDFDVRGLTGWYGQFLSFEYVLRCLLYVIAIHTAEFLGFLYGLQHLHCVLPLVLLGVQAHLGGVELDCVGGGLLEGCSLDLAAVAFLHL